MKSDYHLYFEFSVSYFNCNIIDAYKQADGTRIDGRRVIVDMERGRTVSSFKPRRLGGGIGNTRKAKLPKRLLPPPM